MKTFKDFVRENASPIYHVVDIKTGDVAGKYPDINKAHAKVAREAKRHGATRHRVIAVNNEPIKEDGMVTTDGVAGIGQPPGSKSGEPGVHLPRKKNSPVMGYTSRKPPKM
jgi:hypothetical protein